MSEMTIKTIGDRFKMQFVWQIPEGDYLRAIFDVSIQDVLTAEERYHIELHQLIAWRQESNRGEMRSQTEVNISYLKLVQDLAGHQALVAWESANGRPLHMRLSTLTGEHNFFHRFD